MKIETTSVGDTPNEVCQAVISILPDLIMDVFKELLRELTNDGMIDQSIPEKRLNPDAAIIGCYIGLIRIMSLDGILDPVKAQAKVNEELTDLIKHSRVADMKTCDPEQVMAEVEASVKASTH